MSGGRRRDQGESRTPRIDPSVPSATGAARRWLGRRSWHALLKAWRISSEMLDEETNTTRLLALAILRGEILDELEARDPRAFSVWMAEHRTAGATRPPD